MEILTEVAAWLAEGERVAIATVVASWGSSPRPPGSRMAITASGRLAGSVSGGCVEGAVIEAAQDVMRDGVPQVLQYGVSDERAWSLGLPCGGRMEVFVEAVTVAR